VERQRSECNQAELKQRELKQSSPMGISIAPARVSFRRSKFHGIADVLRVKDRLDLPSL